MQQDEAGQFTSKELEFIIREPMFELTPWEKAASSLPSRESCQCLYTVKCTSDFSTWDMQEMLDYARENHIQCGNTAYAFYVYSLMQEDIIGDYYEIFLPIL